MKELSAYGLMIVVACLVMLIMTKRLSFPLLMDFGMGMVAVGLVGAIDAILSDETCTASALAMRWGLVGGGLFVMFLSISIRLAKAKGRRSTDIVRLSEDEMARVRGRGKS